MISEATTVAGLQASFTDGSLTSVALVTAYLERIAAVDRSGPRLNSVIELNPEALALAAWCDAERAAGRVRGPLHGIPVLLKDNIATADQMETTAGSLALVGARPPYDAEIVRRLRAAGAVILGKTNLSEWANFRGSNSTGGWSGRGGLTKNPYALDRNTSGSSSGSAAAASANLCVVAVGTETNGSIVSPASLCGVVAIKPTVGLVSRFGIIPIAASQDTAGPIARNVRDAAALLGALAGADARDAATGAIPADLGLDFAGAIKLDALKGARIGIWNGPLREHPVMQQVLAALRAAGAEIIDPLELPTFAKAGEASRDVLSYEFKDGLNAYLATLGPEAKVRTLAELIAFNEAHRDREMPYFGQERLIAAEACGPLTDARYLEAVTNSRRLARDEGIDAAMDAHQLDAIVALTAGPAPVNDLIHGSRSVGGSSTLAAVAGYPSVTVPAGDVRGLPVGVSFFGRAWSDQQLIDFAADFEAHASARRVPEFLPTVPLE